MADWTIRFRFGGIESSLEYLEAMAAKGWMLEYWQENTLLFRRAEPRKIRFAMDVVPTGRWSADSDEYNEKMRQEYVSIYEETGWQYVDNQGGKFILSTEKQDIPLPQTDPVAYRETVYKENKKKFLIYCAATVFCMWMIAFVWDLLCSSLTSPANLLLIGSVVCLTMAALFFVILHGTRMWDERTQLRQGIVPRVQAKEGLGLGGVVSFILAIILLVITVGVMRGFQSIQVWGFVFCFLLIILCANVLPWFLHCYLHMPKVKTIRVLKGVCMLLLILNHVIFWIDRV